MFTCNSAKITCISTHVSLLCFIPSNPVTSLSFSLWLLLPSCPAVLHQRLGYPRKSVPVFAVWKKRSEENENRTELDQDAMQPRMLSLAAEREACRSMFNTWAGFPCSLQTIYSLGVISASCPALLSSFSLSCAGCWLLSHVGSAMPGDVYTHENQAPQLCPEPRSYQLWCFFSKALFSLGREEWGDFLSYTFI